VDRTRRTVDGQEWDLIESGPGEAPTTVLMLPGGLCTAEAFIDVMEKLANEPVRVVAATLPGFGGTPHPEDLSLENYASLASGLADEVGAEVLSGHSMGANVVIEMLVRGRRPRAALLLSPTFSAIDEDKAFRMLNRVGRVPGIGGLAWRAALRAMPKTLGSTLPEQSRGRIQAMLANNDPAFCRRAVRLYFQYADRRPDLPGDLCRTGVRTVVAFADHSETALTALERTTLEGCQKVQLVTVADATHMHVVEKPERTAALVLELVTSHT
jgi:pimeloyl-ACP methyl ester carboxylesterase